MAFVVPVVKGGKILATEQWLSHQDHRLRDHVMHIFPRKYPLSILDI